MDAPLLEEAIDLELTLAMVPKCEVTHRIFISPDGSHPDCSLVATHQLRMICHDESALICHELADWLADIVICGTCNKRDCLRVREL